MNESLPTQAVRLIPWIVVGVLAIWWLADLLDGAVK
jgi:hypothetical protein